MTNWRALLDHECMHSNFFGKKKRFLKYKIDLVDKNNNNNNMTQKDAIVDLTCT